jgi:hypothetical protein
MPEQASKESTTAIAAVVALTMPAMMLIAIPAAPRSRLDIAWARHGRDRTRLRRNDSRFVGGIALDDLVELTAIEPDAPALRAIVDLDPLPVG